MFAELLLVLSICTDAFLASFSYGGNNIRISKASALIISTVGAVVLTFSLYLSGFVGAFIPQNVCKGISFGILFVLGIVSIFQNGIKSALRKCEGDKKLFFKCCGIKFVVDIYLDETKADVDCSKTLSVSESFALAIALSMDSLASGFGAGLSDVNILRIAIMAFIGGLLAVSIGCFIGRKAKTKVKPDLSWLNGVILIALAFSKL